ncbi:MAG: amidohydrolase [Leeuwenhoekiella sp.]
MSNKSLGLVLLIAVFFSCSEEKKHVDLIVVNAKVYTVNDAFATAEAFAVEDGKFVKVGTSENIQNTYTADSIIDATGKFIYPGLIDAHCHFYRFGLGLQDADLTGTNSYYEVLERLRKFQKEKSVEFIFGRGWDQNDWEKKAFPTRERLDKLFPNTPVALQRVDGHALLVNSKALDLAGIDSKTKVEGGEIITEDGKVTGVLIDNAMDAVFNVMPELSRERQEQALLDAQEVCFEYGLTTVDDAGLSRQEIEMINTLHQNGSLKMRIYAMVSNTPEDVDYFIANGPIKTPLLNVRSIKVYADGALGSRGAALKSSYSDRENHFGAMVTPVDSIRKLAIKLAKNGFQMNTHAIGDSANVVVLEAYETALDDETDKRWRVEHAQIVDLEDINYFDKNILPSVQPTHATSDMYWAGERLGKQRMKGAYAYKSLLEEAGSIALGTDFPVEQVNPFLTFYAATARKDLEGFPDQGFQNEEALNRKQTLRGMTIWAAYANFEEEEKGSIEPKKFADFIILEKDLMEIDLDSIPQLKVSETYLGGVKVF